MKIKKAVRINSRTIVGMAIAATMLLLLAPAALCKNIANPLSPAALKKTPIRIAFMTSLTGPAADDCQDMLNGIELYLEEIHHKMAGRSVELITLNDKSSVTQGMDRIEEVAKGHKADVIAGVFFAHIGLHVAPMAEKYKIPLVLSVAAADDLTQRKRNGWVIRTSWTSSQTSQPFGEWVYKQLNYKRVVTLGMDYPFSWETIGGFQRSFEESGGKVVQKIWVPLGFTDFAPFIKQIRKDADAVFFSTVGQKAELIAKQYKELGPGLPIIGNGGGYDESQLLHLGDESIGVVTTFTYSASLNTPESKRFVSAYQAKFKRKPSGFAESAYSTGMWINAAVNDVKGNVEDTPKFLLALKNVDLTQAPRGPMKLDSYGNVVDNVYVRKVERVNGVLQNTVIHTFPKVSQFWKWRPEDYLKQPVYSRDYPPCKYCSASD